jgi:predicted small secreted protein
MVFGIRALRCIRGPEIMLKKVIIVLALMVTVFSFAGCKTVQGVGKDIQWIGEKGEQAIER